MVSGPPPVPFLGKRHKTYCCAHWIWPGYLKVIAAVGGRSRTVSGETVHNLLPYSKGRPPFCHFCNRCRRRQLQLATGVANTSYINKRGAKPTRYIMNRPTARPGWPVASLASLQGPGANLCQIASF